MRKYAKKDLQHWGESDDVINGRKKISQKMSRWRTPQTQK